MFRIVLTRKAKKRFKEIKVSYQAHISFALKEIADDPFQGKPLQDELSGQYTYRVGVYRILYKINKKDQTVTVMTAGHRGTVYE
ncbi:MAG: type II toxin-antitoxin system RelE family toxin [Candidatus Levyibacteriota bacterium]